MNAWAITDKGLVRNQNQDAFFVCCDEEKNIALIAVCDGMGGAAAGSVASNLAIEVFSRRVKEQLVGSLEAIDIVSVLKIAAAEANDAVFRAGVENLEYRGMGTTLVAALVTDDTAYVINVGDSRAYTVNGYGISQVTRDHSIVEDMIQRGDITREEARNHPRKNLITRALGPSSEVNSDVFFVNISEGDYIFLCSDGLSNQVSDQEILYEIKHNDSISASCEKLMNIAILRGAPDNVTMILYRK